jgi:hypothetical protein
MRWKWTPLHQEAFEKTKALLSREVMLTFPVFSQPFEIHTDASALQLGAVVAQNKKPIAFFSRKLNPANGAIQQRNENYSQLLKLSKSFVPFYLDIKSKYLQIIKILLTRILIPIV